MTPARTVHDKRRTAKRRGTRFERDVARRLRAEGWYVIRAAGSLGIFDLFAVCGSDYACIECTTNARSAKAKERCLKRMLASGELSGIDSHRVWIATPARLGRRSYVRLQNVARSGDVWALAGGAR
jgi:hypothetical protein